MSICVFRSFLILLIFWFVSVQSVDAKATTKMRTVTEDLESLAAGLKSPKKNIVARKSNAGASARRDAGISSPNLIIATQSQPSHMETINATVLPKQRVLPLEETNLLRKSRQSKASVSMRVKSSSVRSRSIGPDVRGSTDSVSKMTDTLLLKSRSNGVATRETPDPASVTSRLSSIASCARDSVASAVNSVVSPIDEYTRKAVNGVGLVMGVVNGLASGAGTQAYNSMVRVHNTNMDNLERLKDLTRSMSHSVVDLGSSAVAETVNVLDAVRQENNRLIKKATDHVPIVRHLVTLKNVANLANAKGITTIVRGTKRMSDFAIDALAMRKTGEIEEIKDGVSDIMSGMSGMLSEKNANALIDTFVKTCCIPEMMSIMITENGAEDTYEMGNFIGQTAGALNKMHSILSSCKSRGLLCRDVLASTPKAQTSTDHPTKPRENGKG